MKIFIVCSKAFFKDLEPIKTYLEKNNFEVFLPHTYLHPEEEEETWNEGKESHATFKARMFHLSRERIQEMDAILVLNKKKKGIENYIGGSTFLEMYEAFMNNKKIYLYNDIPEGLLYDEISGFSPIIIHGNLEEIK